MKRHLRHAVSPTGQIAIGLIAGLCVGLVFPTWAVKTAFIRDIFLHLIEAMVAPLVFASIVQGVAGAGDARKIGRLGLKTFIYFEIVTTIALGVGLLAVNLLRPGAGVKLPPEAAIDVPASAGHLSFAGVVLHAFPASIIDAMARNDVLQVVVFALIFSFAIVACGEAGRPVLRVCESLTQVMFSFANIVMKFAPLGVAAALAVAIGEQGISVILSLGNLLLTLYAALLVFVLLVLGTVTKLARIPVRLFVRAVREPFLLAFATANSEAALPGAYASMEKFGVPRAIVGFVLPAGYSFNLDGTTLHLAVASIFIAQAAETTSHVHFDLGRQIVLMLTLMLTSKGVAAVPRASLIVLLGALQSFQLPVAGVAVILGIDTLLDMARTSVNVLGNCLASAVIARWEGVWDESMAVRNFG